ncbi:hypothetical protein, partial [Paratractidigestivibacter sp.]
GKRCRRNDECQQERGDERRELVRQELAGMSMNLAPVEDRVDLSRARKVSFGQIATLGAGLASVPETFRTVTKTTTVDGGGTLLRALDASNRPIDISSLFMRKSGALAGTHFGSYYDKGLHQATLVKAGPQVATVTTTVPVDPMTLAIAVAMAEINQKLDDIQRTVDDMFDYMKQRDKSKMRANLKTLSGYINDYAQNWDNQRYLDSAHNDVLNILRESRANMDFYRGQVRKKLADKAPVELRSMVEARLDGVLDSLKDYQLACYTYAFSSFMDPMLSENFSREKLEGVAGNIEAMSIEYRELYTRCYNALEEGAKGSVDANVLGGLSKAGKLLSGAIKSTPLGDATLIDEALDDGAEALGDFNRAENSRLLKKLHQAKSPDVEPFRENALTVCSIYNDSSQLLTDGENIYLLPEDGE